MGGSPATDHRLLNVFIKDFSQARGPLPGLGLWRERARAGCPCPLAAGQRAARFAREPLGHVLLREARAAAAADGLSSSLAMAMAAVEVGVKHLVADLVPQAGWLAVQAPAPPVAANLTDYLPTLPARLVVIGKPITPPVDLIATLKKTVTVRNQVEEGLELQER